MKITEDALETAIAAAKESEVPLILAGEKGVITDVVIDQANMQFDTWAGQLPIGGLAAGTWRYGKVITRDDHDLGAGYNLVVDESGYKFLDPDGKKVRVRVINNMALRTQMGQN